MKPLLGRYYNSLGVSFLTILSHYTLSHTILALPDVSISQR